jgi:tetratricopeptide (TPR) repeat protein
MTIEQQDDKLESIMADPLLAKPANRWSLSLIFVLLALFALKPLIVNRIVARAEAYSSFGLYNNAVRESKKALLLDGTKTSAWNALGSAYKSKGDVDNSVNTYLNAVNVDPANKIAHFRVAMIFSLAQNYNRAIPHFEYIRFLGPELSGKIKTEAFSFYRSSLEMLALCYERTGRPDKLQKVLEELARTYPDYKKNVERKQALVQPAISTKNN